MNALRASCVAFFVSAIAVGAGMADPIPVTLEPVEHEVAVLVVLGADGSRTVYSPATLEEFPTYQLETTTPWRDEAAVFEGVLLLDVLAHHDLLGATSILVSAENEYSTIFEHDALSEAPILIATRVNGAPHSRRARGPIQIIFEQTPNVPDSALGEAHLVWMASRIEASQ